MCLKRNRKGENNKSNYKMRNIQLQEILKQLETINALCRIV